MINMEDQSRSMMLPNLDLRATVGQAANQAAAAGAFYDYRLTLAPNTLRRHRSALELFGEYLGEKGLRPGHLHDDPSAWRGITWGLVDGYYKWLLLQGYSVGSANVNLSTIKTYARLAIKAGMVDPAESQLIETVRARSRRRDRQRIDEQRRKEDIPTRIGAKKAEPLLLTTTQAAELKLQPDTPQGRRDRLLICLLLDHGLRVGEVAVLQAKDVDVQTGILSVYRPKVDKRQAHRLSPETWERREAIPGTGLFSYTQSIPCPVGREHKKWNPKWFLKYPRDIQPGPASWAADRTCRPVSSRLPAHLGYPGFPRPYSP